MSVRMTTIRELRRIPGSSEFQINDIGDCLIVPENQIKPGWIASLEAQGHRCTTRVIGTKKCVLVKLEIGECVKIPQPKPEVTATAHTNKIPLNEVWPGPAKLDLAPDPKPLEVSTKPIVRRNSYKPEEDAFLIKLYNQQPLISQAKIDKMFSAEFSKRSGKSCGSNRIYKLLQQPNNGLIPRPKMQYSKTPPPDVGGTVYHEKTSTNAESLEMPHLSCTIADDYIVELWGSRKTYAEIYAAVAEKFSNEHISTEYRIVKLRQSGRLPPRQKRRNTLQHNTSQHIEVPHITLNETNAPEPTPAETFPVRLVKKSLDQQVFEIQGNLALLRVLMDKAMDRLDKLEKTTKHSEGKLKDMITAALNPAWNANPSECKGFVLKSYEDILEILTEAKKEIPLRDNYYVEEYAKLMHAWSIKWMGTL